MRLVLAGLLALTLAGCAATVTKTNDPDVTSVSWVWGSAQVAAGPDCEEGTDCAGVTITGGTVSEGFVNGLMSPIGVVLKAVMGGV